jgi:arginyl-tRNA synthetase
MQAAEDGFTMTVTSHSAPDRIVLGGTCAAGAKIHVEGGIKDYVFDWDRVLNFDGETGPYVQYTHARACSVLRKADPADVEKALAGGIDASKITGDSAYDLVKLIYRMPAVIEEAGSKYEPSIVTRHIIQIASTFNRFYHDEHILVEDADERIAKIALVAAAGQVIRNGLHLLGIEAPERM